MAPEPAPAPATGAGPSKQASSSVQVAPDGAAYHDGPLTGDGVRAGHVVALDRSRPVLARRVGERQEVFGLRKSGEEFRAEASISKLDVGGERYYTVIMRDITDRKRAERAWPSATLNSNSPVNLLG